MKRMILLIAIVSLYFTQASAYERKSLVERYTNSQCGPCANLNAAWYTQTTFDLLAAKSINHLVYNVNWPSATDPMYLFNSIDNSTRWRYYGVSSVPWIVVNGAAISTSAASNLVNAVTSGNSQFSPFKIILTPVKFVNKVINVRVKILRDPGDVTSFTQTKLKVALTENTVVAPGALEPAYYNIARKMLPDGKGISFDIPAPGDSVELDLLYIPTQNFIQAVNYDSIRVVAFIQNDQTKFIYQSAAQDLVSSSSINSAFSAGETLGASPLQVTFTSYSSGSGSNPITSWKWDFNNDGTIDSEEPIPTWTFTNPQSYNVSLTVSDGTQQHKRTLNNFVIVADASSDILVVNGIDYSNATYIPEMTNFYNSSACFGNNQVDVWDLFGDQGFNYSANPKILKTHLYNRTIPTSILNLYDKVIWIGNNYSGDLQFYNPSQVLQYVQNGGNFLLATRMASLFLNNDLFNYCGIAQVSGDMQINTAIALHDSLVSMSSNSANTLTHYVRLDANSKAIPIFDDDPGTQWIAGFRMRNDNEGAFIFIAGRPYRFNNTASYTNYNYIINNWMNAPVGVNDEKEFSPSNFSLSQNYPNPFNPSTIIEYSIPLLGGARGGSQFVTLKIYDMLGNEVAVLVNEWKEAGSHSVNFSARNGYASGVYYYQLKIGSLIETKKMILIK